MSSSNNGISEEEWSELVTLEYILTWGYTKTPKADTTRYKYLSAKKWDNGFAFDIDQYYKKRLNPQP